MSLFKFDTPEFNPVILSVSGKDAERYLQARLTNDIKNLKDSESILAACLSPQGKTIAVFYIFKVDSEKFILTSLGGNQEEIIKGLSCFIVADRVEVSPLKLNLIAATTEQSITAEYSYPPAFSSDFYYYLLTDEQFASLESEQSLSVNDYNLARIKTGKPYFPYDIPADSLFTEAKLFEAISSTKGCYAGQEVVERSIALGKLPAEIVALKVEQELTDTTHISIVNQEEQEAGKLYSFAKDAGSTYLFARLRSRYLPEQLYLRTEDQELEVIRL